MRPHRPSLALGANWMRSFRFFQFVGIIPDTTRLRFRLLNLGVLYSNDNKPSKNEYGAQYCLRRCANFEEEISDDGKRDGQAETYGYH